MTLQRRTPNPAWIASAALTVLSSAAVAAFTLTSTPTATSLPAPADSGRVLATYETSPLPVSVSIPAAPAPEAAAPATAAPAAAAPATRIAIPRAAAARRVDPLCQGEGWQARRGQAAISRLRRPADARTVPIAFHAARTDVLGMADLTQRRVDVYVRGCEKQSAGLLLHVVAHELGHVLDASRMNSDLRAGYMAARGIPAGTPWFGCNRCADFATPAGDFAETYAQWQRGATTNRSQLAPAPSRTTLAELARTFFAPL